MVKRHLLGVLGASLIMAVSASTFAEVTTSQSISGTLHPEMPMHPYIPDFESLATLYQLDDDVLDVRLSGSFMVDDDADQQNSVIAIPEPGAITLIALAGILSLTRRRRENSV